MRLLIERSWSERNVMSLYGVSDQTRCVNCGDEFANHDYVADSLDQYKCPYMKRDSVYGFFNGGDPRNFHPDGECCSPEEIENHKRACELANNTDEGKRLACPSGWETFGDYQRHVTRAPFGIGTSTYEYETFFESADETCD
jgi:hypothetical protein